MPVNAPRRYLICYDIADPRRLGRVHRFLSAKAVPLQYSVFSGWYRRRELDEILAGLAEIIDSREDDVRAYPLPASPRAVGIGRTYFPPGIILVERGRDLLAPEDAGWWRASPGLSCTCSTADWSADEGQLSCTRFSRQPPLQPIEREAVFRPVSLNRRPYEEGRN